MKKFMLRVMPIVLVAMVIITNSVLAVDIPKGTESQAVKGLVGNIWATVMVVMRVLAVAAIVFAGVKYMFASAESKADIKGGLIGLVVGAVMVFGATFLVDMLTSTAGELTK